MKESVGYTVTINIMIIFITIVFTFLSAALIYFKSNKVSNVITETLEKYEGYYSISENEIESKLVTLGYNRKPVNCDNYFNRIDSKLTNKDISDGECNSSLSNGNSGYCVFECREQYKDDWYYYYKITTNMMINVPIINDILNIPIFSNTNRLYDFDCQEENC